MGVLLQVALVDGVPKTLSFKDCLEHFLLGNLALYS